jgi:hypothetical protein
MPVGLFSTPEIGMAIYDPLCSIVVPDLRFVDAS